MPGRVGHLDPSVTGIGTTGNRWNRPKADGWIETSDPQAAGEAEGELELAARVSAGRISTLRGVVPCQLCHPKDDGP